MKAVTYIQPDLCHCGGLTIGPQIAATAAAHGIGVCPHTPMGSIAGVVGLHFGAAVPNFVLLEEASGLVPWYNDVVDSPIRRVKINEAEARKHPFEHEELAGLEAVIARDGTVASWCSNASSASACPLI